MNEQSSSGLPITLPDPQARELDTTFLPATQTPAQLLALAISKDLDIEKLERLMQMQEQWDAKRAKEAFYLAMSKFQSICPAIFKTDDGYNCKYAALGPITQIIKAPMQECGLSYRWEQVDTPELITVTCIVSHADGHCESNHLSGPPDDSGSMNKLQGRGSAVKYLRRYTLESGLGIESSYEDDNGGLPEAMINAEQAANLTALIDEVKANKARFLKFLNIKKLEDLPASKYEHAVKALESKRK